MCTVSANFSVYTLLEENEVTCSSNRHCENKKNTLCSIPKLEKKHKKNSLTITTLPNAKFRRSESCSLLGHGAYVLRLGK